MSGGAARFADLEQQSDQANAWEPELLRRLWRYARPHRRWIWRAVWFLLLASACRLVLPYLVKVAIDRHLVAGDLAGLRGLALLFLVLAAAEAWLRRRQLVAVETAGQNALYDLRLAVFRHLQQLPARFYDRTPTGRLVGRVTTDVEALQELFSSGVVTILADFVFLGATFAILLALNWQLTLLTLLVVPLLAATTLFVRGKVRVAYVDLRGRLSQMNAFLHEHITGMPVVQMFRREERARGDYQGVNDGVQDAHLRTVRWESLLSALVEMFGSLVAALILWYGGRIILGDWERRGAAVLTLGGLFAFLDYMQKFFAPLNDLSLKYTVMQNAMTASRRIFRLLDEQERLPEPAEPAAPPARRGALEFAAVTFGYGGGEPALKDLSFRVAAGEKVALVGATGSGKTTVLKLMARLYDVQEGAVLLDGVDVRRYRLADLRGRISLALQDVFLFEGTVLDNVRLGRPEVSDQAAIAAASRLHLDRMVERFPGGFHEPVRERGKNLSAGEKQLISLARVLIFAPPVLALDEATANVDSHTEHLLQEAVHEIMAGRTSVVVAHRLSTVQEADRILVLHKGRLVEEGSHDQLMGRRGHYWRLAQLQFQEEP